MTWATFRRTEFQFVAGEPRVLAWAGRQRSFCPACGSPLTFRNDGESDEIDVTVCSLDDPTCVTPADHTWSEDQLPWIQLSDGLPRFPRGRTSLST